ncbi:DNA polymerase IV [Mesorhizobium sp. LNHC252B00]|nr:DNA polymerase IV [Mesorhizobium sp. LNHC252B00]
MSVANLLNNVDTGARVRACGVRAAVENAEQSTGQRKIIHIDMDAFYASVEQRDNPDLRGKPVAVGSARERGVVAAASYEARKFGVRSAMPSISAKRRCPELIFVPPRFDAYRAVSQEIHAIFAEHTPLIEPLALDEAYLDVTDNLQGIPIATTIAEMIRAKIKAETSLTASAGISYNKFLAKLASGQNKPDGLFVITPRMGPAFVEALPVRKFHGVGPATAEKMARLGIETGADLRAQSLAYLQEKFGKSGPYYYWIARGIDERPVRADRERKSVGAEDTFATDLFDVESARGELRPLIEKVWRYCDERSIRGRTVTLKVKFADFQQITRSRTVEGVIEAEEDLVTVSGALLDQVFPVTKGIRLLGVTISNLSEMRSEPDRQMSLTI